MTPNKHSFGGWTKGGLVPIWVIFLHPTISHPLVSGLFLLLASCQGFPKLSKSAGLALPA